MDLHRHAKAHTELIRVLESYKFLCVIQNQLINSFPKIEIALNLDAIDLVFF
jgi:hypothetical protein